MYESETVTSYIYAIQHNKTKKIYVGIARDVEARYFQHISELRANQHRSTEMQHDYNKYGDDYSVFILETVNNARQRDNRRRTKERLAEVKWMKKYNTLFDGYNKQDHVAHSMIRAEKAFCPFKGGLPEVPDAEVDE